MPCEERAQPVPSGSCFHWCFHWCFHRCFHGGGGGEVHGEDRIGRYTGHCVEGIDDGGEIALRERTRVGIEAGVGG